MAVASVEIRVPSPLTLKVPSLRRTSVLPVTCVESPANFKLTAFNCATLTASVSWVPAARPVNWRVTLVLSSPIETAARVDVKAAFVLLVKLSYLLVRPAAGL